MKDHPSHTLPSSGSALSTTLDAGIDLVKISLEELIAEGCAKSGALPDLVDGIQRPQQAGALAVVLSRAAAPTLALTGTAQATGPDRGARPHIEELDYHGAGDCMFAGLGVALANGLATTDALRFATAAGALNAPRHGLGSGIRTRSNASPNSSTSGLAYRLSEGSRHHDQNCCPQHTRHIKARHGGSHADARRRVIRGHRRS